MDFFHSILNSSLLLFCVRISLSGLLGVTTLLNIAWRQEPASNFGDPSSDVADLGLLPTFKNLKRNIAKKTPLSSEKQSYMSIIGDLGLLSRFPRFLSGETEPLRWVSLTVRWTSRKSPCEPVVDVLDREPSESLSETSVVRLCDEYGEFSLFNGWIGNVMSLSIGLKSSLDALRFNRWSNELVRDLFAFMKIVLPPRYWFKNSDLERENGG